MREKNLLEHWAEAKSIAKRNRERAGVPEFPTGIGFLDQCTGGYTPGEIWVIGARPGHGKTSLALQFARNFSDNLKHSVLFLSLEMRGWELVMRMFCEMNNVDFTAFKNGLTDLDPSRDQAFNDYISKIEFEIVEKGYRWAEVENVLRAIYKTKKPDVILLDFMQLVDMGGGDGMNTAIMEYVRSIKEFSKRTRIGFIIVSQLRRPPTGADLNREPELWDLYGSGSLEQMADKVILLSRYVEDDDVTMSHFLNLAKHRQGETIKKQVLFEGRYYRFSEIENNTEIKAVRDQFGGALVQGESVFG